jgi:hypothetical protein
VLIVISGLHLSDRFVSPIEQSEEAQEDQEKVSAVSKLLGSVSSVNWQES